MATVKFNVSEMFSHREPWDCSNSIANLGDQAARLTWQCSCEIARAQGRWLLCDAATALDWVRSDARETGAWDRAEIASWSDEECLAYLVQTIASDMRMLGSDDHSLERCAEVCAETDWGNESEYPRAYVWLEADGSVHGEISS